MYPPNIESLGSKRSGARFPSEKGTRGTHHVGKGGI